MNKIIQIILVTVITSLLLILCVMVPTAAHFFAGMGAFWFALTLIAIVAHYRNHDPDVLDAIGDMQRGAWLLRNAVNIVRSRREAPPYDIAAE